MALSIPLEYGHVIGKDSVVERSDFDTGLLTRALHVKAIDVERRTVDFVASTDVVDSQDEIVDQSTWVLEDYLANPVVLFAHQSRELPIGQALDVGVRNGPSGQQLECKVEFATEELNPKAEQVFRMVQGKFLRAVSVGFIPKTYRWEMRAGVEVWVWADCVLKEISVTPVPANPQALAKMKSLARDVRRAGGAERGTLDQLRGVLSASKAVVESIHSKAKAPPVGGLPTPNAKEGTMSIEIEKALQENADLRAAKALAEQALDEANASVKALTTEKSALEAQNTTLVHERDAALARATTAEDSLVELEVEALVGKKIAPAEKEMFVELRRTNATLFAKMIAQRSDLKLDAPVIAGQNEGNSVARAIDPSAPGATDDVLAEALRLAGH